MQLVREASRPERHEHERTAMHIDPLPNDRERESSLPMSKGCPNLCVCASNAVRRLQGTAGSAYEVSTNGATVDASIDAAAGQSWFAFTAAEGFTYQIETVLGTLDDTVVDLVDTDQSTVLVENDDDERSADSYASYIEWTCPQDGRYFIMVKGYGRATGTFSVMVTEGAGGAGGVGGGDPCNGGVILSAPAAEVSFMPDGNYGDDAECLWMIQCPNGQPATINFEQMQTEADYDFVNIHDGMSRCDVSDRGTCSSGEATIASMSGGMADVPSRHITGTSANTVVQFNSDGSVTDGGFQVSYTCGRAPPPPPAPPASPPAPSPAAARVGHCTPADGRSNSRRSCQAKRPCLVFVQCS